MNIQSDILFFVIFVLSTLMNSSEAFGWYDGYRYNIFSKPQTSEDTETDYPAILSLWSKYHFLRRRRTSVDGNIFKPTGLFMKRFFHYSPFIMKSKNTKSNKAKLKTIQRKQEKNIYRPFNAFGIFINAFKPLNMESVEKDLDFSESVPELLAEENFNQQRQELPSLENAELDWSNEQSRVVPKLSEIESVETIRPKVPINNIYMSDIANEDSADSDNGQIHENHFGTVTSKNTIDAGDDVFEFGVRRHPPSRIHIIPPGDDIGSRFSYQKQHGVSRSSKETAKNLDLPQIVLEPISQRASVSGGNGQGLQEQLEFADPDGNMDQSAFAGFSDESVDGFGTAFHDGYQDGETGISDDGTFGDIIQDNSDFSTDSHFPSDIPEESGFSHHGEILDQSEIPDTDLLSRTGSSFGGSFEPHQDIDSFYNEQFGGGFDNFENLDSSDIAGGEFFNDGNDFEGFFDTDETGCEGIRTRSCNVDTECSCLGLYFCVEGTCGMRAALPNDGHGDGSQTSGSWLDIPAQFR